MATNNNSKTGYYYGVINGNHVSMEALDIGGHGWINLDEVNYYADVKKKLVDWLNDDGEDVLDIAKTVNMERDDDFMDNLVFTFEEGPSEGDVFTEVDLGDGVMQPVYDSWESGGDTWEFSDDEYHLLYDSNENIVWVMDSPYVALVRPAFQGCYPNCGDLDAGDEDYGFHYHALGLEFFDEYSPCPYVPVAIASLKEKEE